MILSFIVAISENNAIGRDNQLPWYLPEDLKFFKRTTMGKPVIMGRNTYASLGKPLPGRTNIVLTRMKDLALPDGVLRFDDINKAIDYLQTESADECFIIGGGKVFETTMSLADCMYVTRIHVEIPDADVFFPTIDHTHWKLVSEEKHDADEKNRYAYTFEKYERLEI
jgi:dihydrofolate reductase